MKFVASPYQRLFIIGTFVITVLYVLSIEPRPNYIQLKSEDVNKKSEIKRNLSKLGEYLFEGQEPKKLYDKTKRFQILVWKYGSAIENRHLKHFSNEKVNPFSRCSVDNCDITFNDSAVQTADIVIIHLHRTKGGKDLPSGPRNPEQIWAFLTDESPYNTFWNSKVKLKEFDGVFNWSMTYRSDSDIPVPYGRTIYNPNQMYGWLDLRNKRRDVLIAVMGSNCGGVNKRWDYIKELEKHIKVDVYGHCGPLKCPGHFNKDCPALDNYLFYLAFENSNCDSYLTEKLFWNAYHKNSIPVIMGTNETICETLLPPKSYLHVRGFANPFSLAQFIKHLNETDEYHMYYDWKKDYEVKNEHGYFQSDSFHFCRVCEALNYNERKPKVYAKLEDFWSVKKDCQPPVWVKPQS